MSKITVKRPVVIKNIITAEFKDSLKSNTFRDVELLDSQIVALELNLKQLQSDVNQNNPQLAQMLHNSIMECSQRLEQLVLYKQNLHSQIEELDKKQLGEQIITGMLESTVELNVGDNIYERLREAQIIVENGTIVQIYE